MKTSTLRKLAKQALNYLASLKQPLPCETNVDWYEQNTKDYQALLKLNKAGLGSTEEELQTLVDTPLSKEEVTKVVKRIKVLDKKYQDEVAYEEKIEKTPKYWDGFFSGYQVTATPQCERIMKGIDNRMAKISEEQSKLFKLVTRDQCHDNDYTTCGMDDEDFKEV